jgi:hypothetical protein
MALVAARCRLKTGEFPGIADEIVRTIRVLETDWPSSIARTLHGVSGSKRRLVVIPASIKMIAEWIARMAMRKSTRGSFMRSIVGWFPTSLSQISACCRD